MAWAPFLAYWWEKAATPAMHELGSSNFLRAIGADVLLRGTAPLFQKEYGRTTRTGTTEGERHITSFHTPIGSLHSASRYSAAGDTWFLTEHPVTCAEDFKILEYIAKDTQLIPDYSEYEATLLANPDALQVPLVTPEGKTAFQSMIEYWVGTEELCYMLADDAAQIEPALAAMQALSMEGARLSAASPAEAFISWEDTSTTNLSPTWYERYVLPEINGWCDILHSKNKLYIQHACGHLRALAPLIAASHIDAIESVSAPPTGDITPLELANLLPNHIAMISGIEPTFFMNATLDELAAHVAEVCHAFAGRRFILANADSCPPSVAVEKFGFVSKQVHELFGKPVPAIRTF